MARLPNVGGDDGNWGTILNDFLSVSLDNTNVDEGERGKLIPAAVDAAGAVMNSDTSTASMSFVVDEDDMSSNSATKVPTQQSVKAYIDSGSATLSNKTLTSPVINTGVSGTAIDTDTTLAANSDTKLASQKAAKSYVDNKLATPTTTGGIGYRPKGLDSWYTKFAAATSSSPVDVVVISDSIWDIGTITTDPAPVSLLARQLNALKGMKDADTPGGSTLPPIVHAHPGSGPSATSSQGTVNATSTGQQGSTLTNGQILTHTATCTSFTVVYRTDPSYGTMTIRDGAGGTVLGTINCAATAKSGNIWTSGAISDASHTLHITSTGTTCPELISPNYGQSVRVWPCGLAGATSTDYSSTSAKALDFIDTLEAAGTLGLVLIATGVNDTTYSTAVPALISAVQSHTSANIALWLSYMCNAFPASEYGPARTAALATGLPLIDGSLVADQTLTVDGTHPATGGRTLLATHVTSVIGGDPIGSALRYAGSQYIGRGTNNMRISESTIMLNNDTAIARSQAGTLAVGSPLSLFFGTADGVVIAGQRKMINSQTGTSYSVALADQAKIITRTNSSVSTQTWPSDSTAAIGTGTIIETINLGSEVVSHVAGSSATVSGTTMQPSGTTATAVKTAADTWAITIDGPNLRSDILQNTSLTYTLLISDQNKTIDCNNASAQTVTVPPNSSVAFPVGTRLIVRQYGAGQVTLSPGSGVTLNSMNSSLVTPGQYGGLMLHKRATDEWIVTSISNLVVDTDTTLTANSDSKIPSQKAVKTYIDNSLAPTESQLGAMTGFYVPPEGLYRFKTSSRAIRRIAIYGDSTLQGNVNNNQIAFPFQLEYILKDHYPGEPQPGLHSVWTYSSQFFNHVEWSFSGTWSGTSETNSAFPTGKTASDTGKTAAGSTSNIATWTRPATLYLTKFDLIFTDKSITGGGSISYSIDGGTTWVDIALTNPATPTLKVVTVTTTNPTTVKIRAASSAGVAQGINELVGIVPYNGTTGFAVENIAKSGLQVYQAFGLSGSERQWKGWFQTYLPELTIFMITNNTDQDPISSGLTAWCETKLQELQTITSGDIILFGQFDQNAVSRSYQQSWRDQWKLIAANNKWGYIDLRDRWGDYTTANAAGLMADSYHPTTKGGQYMASALWRFLNVS